MNQSLTSEEMKAIEEYDPFELTDSEVDSIILDAYNDSQFDSLGG